MATLRTRLNRLEDKKRETTALGPSVIFLCEAGGEPMGAMRMGGGNLTREDGESVEAFTARAMGGASVAIHLPDNGREMPSG